MNELKYWINDMDEWIFHTLEEDFSMQTKRENSTHRQHKDEEYTQRERERDLRRKEGNTEKGSEIGKENTIWERIFKGMDGLGF